MQSKGECKKASMGTNIMQEAKRVRDKTCLEDKKSWRAGTQMREEKLISGRQKDRRQSRRDEGREGQRPKRDRLMGKREAKRESE